MQTVHVGPLAMQVDDRGAGRPLLFVHGFPLDHTMWRAQLDHFAASHRTVAPDLRGFGATPATEGTTSMEQFADDLAGLLDALGIGEPITLCGLSMGGYIAWQFVRKYPQRLRALVLCDTRAAADAPEAAANRRILADKVLRDGMLPIAESMVPKLFSSASLENRPELIDEVRQTILASNPVGVAAALRGMADRPDMRHSLSELTVPTLAIVGADDAITPPDEMCQLAESLPNARLLMVRGAGHMAPLECPEVVNAVLDEFLK